MEDKDVRDQNQGAMEEMETETCCGCRTKIRDETEQKDLIHRLNRIEGQVRGIRKMVEEHKYCVDILTQVTAVKSALHSFNRELLANHVKTCVVQDIQQGKDETIDELLKIIQKLMR